MQVKVLALDPKCFPIKGSEHAAAVDLKSANEKVTLLPGSTIKIHTGIKVEIPTGYFGLVLPRSGLGSRFNVRLANTAGVIDSDYRGEIMAFLHNAGEDPVTIEKYDRFMQMLILPVPDVTYVVADKLSDTSRGETGFGSTGHK